MRRTFPARIGAESRQAGRGDFPRGQLDQLVVAFAPEGILVVAPILQSEDRRLRVAVELGNPVAEVGDPAHAQLRRMNVEPLVAEQVRAVNVEIDQDRVAEAELVRRGGRPPPALRPGREPSG